MVSANLLIPSVLSMLLCFVCGRRGGSLVSANLLILSILSMLLCLFVGDVLAQWLVHTFYTHSVGLYTCPESLRCFGPIILFDHRFVV